MQNQSQHPENHADGWPMPSDEVRRELEPQPVAWGDLTPEPEPAALAA